MKKYVLRYKCRSCDMIQTELVESELSNAKAVLDHVFLHLPIRHDPTNETKWIGCFPHKRKISIKIEVRAKAFKSCKCRVHANDDCCGRDSRYLGVADFIGVLEMSDYSVDSYIQNHIQRELS